MDDEAICRHPLWGPSCPHRRLGESSSAAKAFSSSLAWRPTRDDQLEFPAVLSRVTSIDPVLQAPAQLVGLSNPQTGILGMVRSEQSRDEIGLSLQASP